jgi:hypothetical protein
MKGFMKFVIAIGGWIAENKRNYVSSPRNTDPFFVMLGCSTTEDRLLKPSEGLKW